MTPAKPYKANESRAARLRRLSAKKGFYDGNGGSERAPPFRMVSARNGRGVEYRAVADDQWFAYFDGYEEGRFAGPHARNPYGNYSTTTKASLEPPIGAKP